MKATTQFLNEIVLVNQPRKLTPVDRSAVRQHLLQRWMRTPKAERDLLFNDAAKLLAHYGWPTHITALVLRLIINGVTGNDDLLARAWAERRLNTHDAHRQAIARYGL